jgi:hypothetical protein
MLVRDFAFLQFEFMAILQVVDLCRQSRANNRQLGL